LKLDKPLGSIANVLSLPVLKFVVGAGKLFDYAIFLEKISMKPSVPPSLC